MTDAPTLEDLMQSMERTRRESCPGLSAWDIPGACTCDRPTLGEVVRARALAEAQEFRANFVANNEEEATFAWHFDALLALVSVLTGSPR